MDVINTNLVSLDPAVVIDPLATEFVIGSTADGNAVPHATFSMTQSAMNSVYEIASKLEDADRSIKALGDKPDPATDARMRKNAQAAMGQAKKTIADTYISLSDHAARIAGEADELVGTQHYRAGVTENARGAEVRQWLRELSPTLRTDALNEALTAKDREIIASVLAASPVLSGMKREHHSSLANDAHAQFAPDQHRLMRGIAKLTKALQTADGVLMKRYAGITGVGSSRQAEAERAINALGSLEGSAA